MANRAPVAFVPNAALYDHKLSDGARCTLWAIAAYANDVAECFPSVATIAADRDIEERSVQRHIHELVARRHLKVIRRRGRSNSYVLLGTAASRARAKKPPAPDQLEMFGRSRGWHQSHPTPDTRVTLNTTKEQKNHARAKVNGHRVNGHDAPAPISEVLASGSAGLLGRKRGNGHDISAEEFERRRQKILQDLEQAAK